jgi:Arc/MetJ-type ribon-helix-helix transcriptional regulator
LSESKLQAALRLMDERRNRTQHKAAHSRRELSTPERSKSGSEVRRENMRERLRFHEKISIYIALVTNCETNINN